MYKMTTHGHGNQKVAIVHDWLVGGGAERVVMELHRMFPEAPIYTSYATPEWQTKLDGKVVTGYLQHWPFSALRKFLPVLRQYWFGHLDLSAYDLVISSSGNGEAKGIRVSRDTVHICYCHSPTHFYWRHYDQYLARPGFGMFDPLARFGLRLLVGPLRRWDYRAAQRPDYFIANSRHIQADIKKYYGRESVVIRPPVDVERFSLATQLARHGFVTVGRQVPHKHTDLIVAACTKLSVPLTVIGRGPEHQHLMSMAGPTVTFLDAVTDAEIPGYLVSAEAFLFASFEDFGVTPVEAMAAGTPVIAYRAGGALDYVVEDSTGLFFDKQNTESLEKALQQFLTRHFDSEIITNHAQQFSTQNFAHQLKNFISSHCSLG